jgi:hypothetical protein
MRLKKQLEGVAVERRIRIMWDADADPTSTKKEMGSCGAFSIKGLFYFADTEGIPLDTAILHLRSKKIIDGRDEFYLLLNYVSDAIKAGWSKPKTQSELREARMCGGIGVPEWLLR